VSQIAREIEPFEPTERDRLTAAERAELLARQGDCCGNPQCRASLIWQVVNGKPVYGPMIDEHILPVGLGGSNELFNRALYCVPCAKTKTKDDLRRMRKADRQGRSHRGEKLQRGPKLKGRGFRKDPLSWRNP
jgi:hypothetical protein